MIKLLRRRDHANHYLQLRAVTGPSSIYSYASKQRYNGGVGRKEGAGDLPSFHDAPTDWPGAPPLRGSAARQLVGGGGWNLKPRASLAHGNPTLTRQPARPLLEALLAPHPMGSCGAPAPVSTY